MEDGAMVITQRHSRAMGGGFTVLTFVDGRLRRETWTAGGPKDLNETMRREREAIAGPHDDGAQCRIHNCGRV